MPLCTSLEQIYNINSDIQEAEGGHLEGNSENCNIWTHFTLFIPQNVHYKTLLIGLGMT